MGEMVCIYNVSFCGAYLLGWLNLDREMLSMVGRGFRKNMQMQA